MHRFRSWTLDPPEWRTQRNRLLPTEGGDGSTLSLDFTTSNQLDSKVIFERSTNATFINSQGLVQWADSNLFYNSTWTDANDTPSGWFVGTGTASRSNETRTFTTSASQVYITQTRSTNSGIRYSASVEVTAVTGTQRVDDVIVALGGSSYQYYFNGSAVSGTTSLTPGIVGLAFTAGGATTTVRVGSGVQGTNTTGAVTLRHPQFEPGTVASRIYRPNSSTTSSYQAPRFYYDPITLVPKGLLIEPQTVNVAALGAGSNSNTTFTLYNTGASPNYETLSLVEGIDGINGTAASFTLSANGFIDGRYSNLSTGVSTFGVTSGQVYTASFYYKFTRSGTPLTFNTRLVRSGTTIESPTTSIDLPGPNGFTRRVVTFTANASVYGVSFVYGSFQAGDIFEITGIQVELGSSASSYIPTGASAVTRSYDACYIPTANFTTSETNWSILSEWEDARADDTTAIQKWVCSTASAANNGTGVFYSDSGSFPLNGGVSNAGDAISTTPVSLSNINKAAFSFVRTPTAALRMSLNGENISTGTQGQVDIPDKLNIGSRAYSSAGRFLGGYIRKIKYWPSLLSDNQLKALSSFNYLSPAFAVDFVGMNSLSDLTSKGFIFSRSTPATFINSSGYVSWAATNIMNRSQSQDSNTYWNAFGTSVTRTGSQSDPLGGTGAVKLDYNATSADAVISRTVSVQQGLQYTISVWLRADSGTVNNVRFGRGASAAGAYFPSLTTTWQRFSLTFTATGGSDGMELRVLTSGTPKTASFHVFGAQLEPGGTMRDYNPALLDVPYHAPRFDHDPDTLAPRGLLIEGQSTNRFQQSSDWTVSPWSKPAQITWDGTTYATAPDGTNTAKQITVTSGSSASVSQFVSLATNRTISLWIRAGSLTSFSIGAYDTSGTAWGNNADSTCEIISGPGSKTQQIGGLWSITGLSTTEWTRVQVFRSSTYSALLAYPGSSSGTITGTAYMWGMQMQDGNGASSLIPTGASQGTKEADICYIDTAEVNSWFIKNNEATFQVRYSCDNPLSANGNIFYLGQWAGGEYSYGYQHYTYAGSGGTLSANGKLVAATSRDNTTYQNQSLPLAVNAAFSFSSKVGFVANSWNGNTPSQLAASVWPAWSSSTIRLGVGTNTISGSAGFMRVLSLTYWPTVLPNATLQNLTV
jgi:hypothetical protein